MNDFSREPGQLATSGFRYSVGHVKGPVSSEMAPVRDIPTDRGTNKWNYVMS